MSALDDAFAELVRNAVREELAQVTQLQEPAKQAWFSVKGAAEYTGTTEDAVRSAIKSGQLKSEPAATARCPSRARRWTTGQEAGRDDLDAYAVFDRLDAASPSLWEALCRPEMFWRPRNYPLHSGRSRRTAIRASGLLDLRRAL